MVDMSDSSEDRPSPAEASESGDEDEFEKTGVLQLKKTIGLASAVALNVGSMIGSGIFISPKGVLMNTGSVGLSLVVWALCGVLSLMAALCFAELGTLVPKSGGPYAYLIVAYGSFNRFIGPLPGFLFFFLTFVILAPSGLAIVSLTCARYILATLFGDELGDHSYINVKIIAGTLIVSVTVINCLSVNASERLQIVLTVVKVTTLAVIIVVGNVRLFQGYTSNFSNAFAGTKSDIGLISLGFYSCYWSYDGWASTNIVTEELINPNRNLPLCIWISVPLVTLCYVLTNISYFTVMSPQQLLASPTVAVTWGDVIFKEAAFLIPLSVAFSAFGALNGGVFTGARMNFAAAREGQSLEILSMISRKFYTPIPSLLINAVLGIIWLIPSSITNLIDTFGFTIWLVNGLCIAGLLVLRKTKRDEERIYKVPLLFPIIVLLVSIGLVFIPIVADPLDEFVVPLGVLVVGILLYTLFVFYKFEIPGFRSMTKFLQRLLQVLPLTQDEAECELLQS